MSDLAIAAASAGSQQPVPMDIVCSSQAAAAAAVPESPRVHHENPFELPSVDDLEVAAAAAAAAMQAMHELQQESEEEEGEEEEDSSSDEDEYSESDELESNDLESQQQRQQPVSLRLTAGGDGTITVALEVHPQHQQQEDVVMMSRDGASGSSSDESEEDSGSSSSSETSSDVESIDYNEMRDFIDKAYKVADDDDGDAAGPVPTLEEDLGLPGSIAPLSDILIPDDAQLKQAGSIMSVLEGMVVVQGLANSRALDYGSVFMLEDKTPIGRVEEVFGPITHPLYALRYAGPQPAPAGLVSEARVFFTDSLSSLVEDQVYTDAGAGVKKKAAVDYEADAEEEEVYFSDDEAEAEWRRSQGFTKRKHQAAADNGSGNSRGRGRGRYGRSSGSSNRGGRGGPSAGFKAHATAGQLQNLGLQQDGTSRAGRGQKGGRGRGQQGGRGMDGNQQQHQQQTTQQQPAGWQNGAPGFHGYPQQQQQQQQQPYPPLQQMPPGGYVYPQIHPVGYMPQPMTPQGQVIGPPGAYGHPGMAGPPAGITPMGAMQHYHGQPTGYGAQQWTGYGAPRPPGR